MRRRAKRRQPRYDFPGCGSLLLALAILGVLGVMGAGSDVVQNAVHYRAAYTVGS